MDISESAPRRGTERSVTARTRLGVTAAAGGLAVVWAIAAPAPAASVNLSGTWQSNYDCTTGSCPGTNFPDTLTLTQAPGSDTVTGADELDGTLTGTLSGSALTLTETDGSYTAHFSVTIAPDGQSWSGTLSDSNGTSGIETAILQVPPAVAQSGDVVPVSGTVLVRAPGQQTFQPLTSSTSIPMGSLVDATKGTAGVTVAVPGGATQSGNFYDGEFAISQAASGITTEKLAGGDFAGCPAGKTTRLASSATAAKKRKTVVRELWGNAHGDFKTSGRAGAAAVLGTIWLTEDRCDGTLFKAVKDAVTVTDFAHPAHKHVVRQGHSYFAPLYLRGQATSENSAASSSSAVRNVRRSCVWIWQTRLSDTPSTSPTSRSVMFCT